MGHANTKEGGYAKRWATEKKLPEGVEKKGLPSREKEGQYGKYTEYQIENEDPYTLANTVLKMAKKRAQVDGALTVASLSEIFTQDLEDGIADIVPKQKPIQPTQPPKPKPEYVQQTENDLISTAQAKRLFALAKGNEDLVKQAIEKFNYASTKDIKRADYQEICKYVEGNEEIIIPWEVEEKANE